MLKSKFSKDSMGVRVREGSYQRGIVLAMSNRDQKGSGLKQFLKILFFSPKEKSWGGELRADVAAPWMETQVSRSPLYAFLRHDPYVYRSSR